MADINSLIEAFTSLPRSEQDVVLAELAKRVVASHNGEATLHLTDTAGTFVGYLFAAKRSTAQPRLRTPEERGEDEHRFRNRDDAVSADEIIALERTSRNCSVHGGD